MDLRDIGSSLPPGFRFYPSDEELVCHYLYKKIANEDVLKGTLVEIDLHKCEPWQLPGMWSLFPPPLASISMAAILFSFWEVSCFGCAIVVFQISFCFKLRTLVESFFFFFLKKTLVGFLKKKLKEVLNPFKGFFDRQPCKCSEKLILRRPSNKATHKIFEEFFS